MKKIVLFPSKILRQRAEEIKRVDSRLKNEIDCLVKLLEQSENGAGLAGPQAGIKRRLFVLKKRGGIEVFINPKIERTWGRRQYFMIEREGGQREYFLEGCLSFPGFFGRVKRYLQIEASWAKVEEGKLVGQRRKLLGFEAVVFTHELDHLNGVLFVDYVKGDKSKLFRWDGEKMVRWPVAELLAKEKAG